MSKKICIYNNKGGVGKTTTALMFSQILAKEGKNPITKSKLRAIFFSRL